MNVLWLGLAGNFPRLNKPRGFRSILSSCSSVVLGFILIVVGFFISPKKHLPGKADVT